MPKCYRCGKWGLFLKVTDGFCDTCLPRALVDASIIKKRLTPARPVDEYHPSVQQDPAKTYLGLVDDRFYKYEQIIDNYTAIYNYRKVLVAEVNYSILKHICETKKYVLSPEIQEDGSVALLSDGIIVCKLAEKIEMCKDWIQRGDPIHCEFVAFHPDSVYVSMTFYRDEYRRLRNHSYKVIRLSSYTSADIQENLNWTRLGAKVICVDDILSEREYVCDLDRVPIGCLPTKFQNDNFNIDGRTMFLDHIEITADDLIVPYVRVYE